MSVSFRVLVCRFLAVSIVPNTLEPKSTGQISFTFPPTELVGRAAPRHVASVCPLDHESIKSVIVRCRGRVLLFFLLAWIKSAHG